MALELSLPLRLLLISLISIAIPLCSYASTSSSSSLQQQQPTNTSSSVPNGGGGGVEVELWCVAKNNAGDSALQSAIDWACGPGGADCGPIQQGGPCYDAADIRRTASYAFNSYFLKNGMTEESCNFDNTAALTSLDPSHDKCKFLSSMGGRNGSPSQGSADISCGDYVASSRWVWTVIVIHLLIIAINRLIL